ncbi:glycosyltransferase family 2 protein [Patescibacteria group bacterium]|nr:glycosyltransferase family 2 protein [Patescibacteria group bacterium]MBU1124158.1 glycosyltransferase family 2 protein [Patescibacteria group bacterium]MBU1911468.1 glycosyltransferase family 2 protein [Patescibacteria group bacterium]
MDEKLPISVHVLTWNSGKTLRATLESVKQCKEILIIDGGSTDDTLRIASEYSATVIPQRDEQNQGKPITNFSEVRNRALSFTTQPWILALDSDETASVELMEEIGEISMSTTPSANWVPRRYVCDDGTVIAHASTYPNKRIYFFHKDAVNRWIKPIHERVELNDGVHLCDLNGYTKAPLPTVKEFKEKNLEYIKMEVSISENKGWGFWLKRRLYHTLRSRLIAIIRLLWIWLIPRKGKRLPLKHEFARFWYAWKLITLTFPLRKNI